MTLSFLYFISSIQIFNIISTPIMSLPRTLIDNLKHFFHGHVHLRARLHSGPIRYCFGITLRGKNSLLYKLLEAGGKPSTKFPPEGLVELTCNSRSTRIASYVFYGKNQKFRKIIKCHISKFYRKLSVAQTLPLHYGFDN